MNTNVLLIVDIVAMCVCVVLSGVAAVLWRRLQTLEDIGDIRQRKHAADVSALWRVLGAIEADALESSDRAACRGPRPDG